MAGQGDDAAVGGRQDDVDHLDGFELVDDLPRGEAGGVLAGDGAQGRQQAQGHERREDVGLDAVVEAVVDGSEAEVVLEFAEGVFDFALDHVLLPEGGGVAVG